MCGRAAAETGGEMVKREGGSREGGEQRGGGEV